MAFVFEAKVHNSGRRFTIPKDARDNLGIGNGDTVFLIIRSPDRKVLFKGRKSLRSGPEIYGTDISSALTPGSTILVKASRSRVAEWRSSKWSAKSQSIARREPRSGHATKNDKTQTRQFWIVSPNVMNNNDTVPEWRNASVVFKAAFMGWGPNEEKHKRIGFKFAHVIKPGDIILIARRHEDEPEVVGFGVVTGDFKTTLKGFATPKKEEWHGSLRELSPFVPWTKLPETLKITHVLRHTTALRQLVPTRNQNERLVCEWLQSTLAAKVGSRQRTRSALRKKAGTRLTHLPHDRELEFLVRNSKQVKLALKREAELVRKYSAWLEGQRRVLRVAQYGSLRCDAYEEGRNNLIEAKCSARREYIRMAVGQLLDYAHLGEHELGKPNLGILLPERPAPDIEIWLKKKLKISVIWKEENDFLDSANGKFT
jgi:bifunctional DNA-binding transcriptional regulator/antitoxin component of YhaV-PrlF toxin-antitoxin module